MTEIFLVEEQRKCKQAYLCKKAGPSNFKPIISLNVNSLNYPIKRYRLYARTERKKTYVFAPKWKHLNMKQDTYWKLKDTKRYSMLIESKKDHNCPF